MPASEPRELTDEERALLVWLLREDPVHGPRYLDQADDVWVVGTCDCGCPSIDLARRPETAPTLGFSLIAADFIGKSPEGIPVGVLVHVCQGLLSRLEVYSATGDLPVSLPRTEDRAPRPFRPRRPGSA